MAEVFEGCALGMMSLMVDLSTVEPAERVELEAAGRDRASLLISWLAEILFRVETEWRLFRDFHIGELTENRVAGWGMGETLDPERHRLELEVKAPTYHMLELEESQGRWTARVIFDV
jgi:SHS2 domain-containing protein